MANINGRKGRSWSLETLNVAMSTSLQNISLLYLHWAQRVSRHSHTRVSSCQTWGLSWLCATLWWEFKKKNHRVMKKVRRMVATWSIRKYNLLCSPSDCKLNNPLTLKCLDWESSTGPGSAGQKASRSCKHPFTWSLLPSRFCGVLPELTIYSADCLFPSPSNKQHPSSSDL